MEELLEHYKNKQKTIKQMLEEYSLSEETFKRLKIKHGMINSFVADIEREMCNKTPHVSYLCEDVTLMNEQKLGDTYINWLDMSPEHQWQRIDAMLHKNGLKVIRIATDM